MPRPEQDSSVAGLMYIPLTQEGSPTWNIDFVVFLRLSKPHEIRWAGKPQKWDPPKTRRGSPSPVMVYLSASGRKYSEDYLEKKAATEEDVSEAEMVMKTMEPRKSFDAWTEVVRHRSVLWTEEQIETGKMLSVVYGKVRALNPKRFSFSIANDITVYPAFN
jgi:light-regulated signal transduction histidine kinase (bacteriophytochrome)